jgi:hypothetical protein
MPEMGAVEIEWLFIIRQQIPGVTGEIEVHPFLRHDLLRRIQNWSAISLMPDSADLAQIVGQI